MYIQELLTQRRIALAVNAASKTALLEQLAALLGIDNNLLDQTRAAQALQERERLGSTGIGSGVAVPHGRVSGLAQPIGAFCTLAQPLDFGAIDHKPVTMAFALLVPDHANNQHLKVLAELAGLFSDKQWREELRAAKTAADLYNQLTQPRSARPHDTQTHRSRSV